MELLAAYSGKASAGLDLFSSEERHQTYKKLRLVVLVRPNPDDPRGDLEVMGVLNGVGEQAEGLSKSTAHPGVQAGEGVRRPAREGYGWRSARVEADPDAPKTRGSQDRAGTLV